MMSYKTLMVHMDLEEANDARLRIAADLAKQFEAKAIGITAGDFQPMYFLDGMAGQSFLEQEAEEIRLRMDKARDHFNASLEGAAREIEWRCKLGNPTTFVTDECRSADLIITGGNRSVGALETMPQFSAADLAMRAGRPILLVPPEAERLNFESVLVAWKDTRETRKAVRDALPLLHMAKQILIVEILEGDRDRADAVVRVEDVVVWFARHGITASALVTEKGGSVSQQLRDIAREQRAQLVIAGAYGHSRLREWIFGGVTEALLTEALHYSLIAH